MGIKKLKKLLKEKIKNKYYQIKNDKIIKEYNKYKENRKAKGVIYTYCILLLFYHFLFDNIYFLFFL